MIQITRGKSMLREIVVVTTTLLGTAVFFFFHANVSVEVWKHEPCSNGEPSNHANLLDNHLAQRLPQAIIIGTRKSGTRALLKFLEINPLVRPATREVHFFDKPQHYKHGYDWYRSQMPLSTNREFTIEKSPAYFVTQEVPERVKAMNSSVKLIVIFRDPVTRLISDFSQLAANRIGDSGDEHIIEDNFSDNLTAAAWNKAERDFVEYVLRADGGIDDQRRAIQIGMYSTFVERWRSFFPLDQFHFVDGENLVINPFEELRKLESFLGLPPKIRPEDFVFNTQKGFYCVSNHKNKSSVCLSKSKGRRHVNVKKDLIGQLRKFYKPYNEYLYSLIEKNLNWPIN